MTQKIRDEEIRAEESKWENERKKHLEKVQEDVKEIAAREDGDLKDLCEYIFEKHPPKHIAEFKSKKPDFTDMGYNTGKRPLQKMVTLYHPDRVDMAKNGAEYFVLCEEITKVLNKRYNDMKM